MSPKEYADFRMREIDQLEKKYDFSTIQGIEAIPVPKAKAPRTMLAGSYSMTAEPGYYLQHKASDYMSDNNADLAVACLKKSNELMPFSPMAYGIDTYLRLPRYLRKLRRFDEARFEENKIFELFDINRIDLYLSPPISYEQHCRDFYYEKNERILKKYYNEYLKVFYEDRRKEFDRAYYDWLWENFPDECPKSFSAYRRMKKGCTTGFQKIKEKIKRETGVNIAKSVFNPIVMGIDINDAPLYCGACGATVKREWKFCLSCGAEIKHLKG